MKVASFLALLLLTACGAAKDGAPGESGSEASISDRAAEIRAETDAEINRQIAEIDEAANAESPAISADSDAAQ